MNPKWLNLQWHITERCNLKCKHCYQGCEVPEDLSIVHLHNIFEQYAKFLFDRQIRGHLVVTGGEPFIRKDFPSLLETIDERKHLMDYGILSNGTFIDRAMAEFLKSVSPRYVQVSMEGSEEIHDSIRGNGSFQKTINAIKELHRVGIKTLISFTAHKGNYKEFPKVVEIGRKLKVGRVWSDRLIPMGTGDSLEQMSQYETAEWLTIMNSERIRLKNKWFNKTEVAMHRALQFLKSGTTPYQCKAGKNLLTVQANGDLVPCRRMPIVAGNVFNSMFETIYETSAILKQLREETDIEGCVECKFKKVCNGGLRCLSYAIHGTPFKKDPGCWVEN
ncbi:MAG: radical SAM protein [Candidatus Peribacteraceae bacterium]|nr:radical SAM protein [Candidatus Peribacteraceae bacterium]